jgi:hypothetical protein
MLMKTFFDDFFSKNTSELEMMNFLKMKFMVEFSEWKIKQAEVEIKDKIKARAEAEAKALQQPFDLDKMCEDARQIVYAHIEREYKRHVKEMSLTRKNETYSNLTIVGGLTEGAITGHLVASEEYLKLFKAEFDKVYISKKELPHRITILGYTIAYGKLCKSKS